MVNELQIITNTYELLRWTVEHVARFARHHRNGIGRRLECKLHDLLEVLIEAKYTRNKLDLLHLAGCHLEQARLMFRLSKDLRQLAISSYGFAAEQLTDVSRQLSAWRQSTENRR